MEWKSTSNNRYNAAKHRLQIADLNGVLTMFSTSGAKVRQKLHCASASYSGGIRRAKKCASWASSRTNRESLPPRTQARTRGD
jgi:hypothetical protein